MIKNNLKKFLQVIADIYFFNLAFLLALLIRFEGFIPSEYITKFQGNFIWMSLAFISGCIIFKLYNRLWSYASIHDAIVLGAAVTISSAAVYATSMVISAAFPRSIYLISWILCLLFLGGYRLGFRIFKVYKKLGFKKIINEKILNHHPLAGNANNILIVGAGTAGNMALKELNRHQGELSSRLIGFLDDDSEKQNCSINGIKVLGPISKLEETCRRYNINEVIIAMPSAPRHTIRSIINTCSHLQVKTKILPAVHDLIAGKVSVSSLREVNIEDLLKRDPVDLDIDNIAGYIKGKTILVTGAGGSIGSELCRQILKFEPAKLTLLDHSENNIYEIYRELIANHSSEKLNPVIADIQDRRKIFEVAEEIKPDVVFHAGAHKHVPLMEKNPGEAVKNNIFGTQNTAEAAHEIRAERFVLVSTDKAVNPKSVMGATKRAAEMIVQILALKSETKFCAVRFGNVLASSGSVIPLFKEQIRKGGPVTVTHPDMTRYFMTIPEACQLVIEAGSMGKEGEVFLLDMGEPVKIIDLAKDLIKLSGYEPQNDIPITFTGVREGEKIFEELLTKEEEVSATQHDRIYTANNSNQNFDEFKEELSRLKHITNADLSFLIKQLEKWHKTNVTEKN